MKRILFLLAVLPLLFAGCSKVDYTTPNEQEVWVCGYTAYRSGSDYEKDNVKFIFFKLDNGVNVQADKKTFNGTFTDYMKSNDENYELLRKENKIKLESGDIISAYHVEDCSRNTDAYNIMSLPVGRYYVAAIYSGMVYLQGMYISEYALKYAGKYIDIEYNFTPTVISVVMPADCSRYGCIDWVSWNEKFPYNF
jgi:hypothetical protein